MRRSSTSNAGATLTQRVHQDDAKELIHNSQWAFADCSTTAVPGHAEHHARSVSMAVSIPTTSTSWSIRAKNPTVTGIGFAGDARLRLLSARAPTAGRIMTGRHGDGPRRANAADAANPLGNSIQTRSSTARRRAGAGSAPSCSSGSTRARTAAVFEGAIPHKASNRGAFNIRFAQPTRLSGTQHTETQFPGQESPQTWDVSHDPIAGDHRRAARSLPQSETCPKITATVTDTEYWQSLMSLNTTDAERQARFRHSGERPDLPLRRDPAWRRRSANQPPCGAAEAAGQLPAADQQQSVHPGAAGLVGRVAAVDHRGASRRRASIRRWRSDSLVPVTQINSSLRPGGEFHAARALDAALPSRPRRRISTRRTCRGVMAEPPVKGEAYARLLPRSTPTATRSTGCAIPTCRRRSAPIPAGTPQGGLQRRRFLRSDGRLIPFFETKAQRLAAGDPRLSIQERYPTHADYVARSRRRRILVKQRLLLQQDAELIISQANAAAVP